MGKSRKTVKISIAKRKKADTTSKSREECLEGAVRDVREKKLSLRKAALKWGVKKTTIGDRVSGRVAMGRRSGPAPILNSQEEQKLTSWLINMAGRGLVVSKVQLLRCVKKILDKDGRENPLMYKDTPNLPGDKWYRQFIARNPDAKAVMPGRISSKVTQVSTAEINLLLQDFEKKLLKDVIINKPIMPQIILVNSVIKWYRRCPIRPPDTFPLPVNKEFGNRHDKYGLVVCLPELKDIPEDQHNLILDGKRQLKLFQVAGISIGEVPFNLNEVLYKCMFELSAQVTCCVTGNPKPDFPPWKAPDEEDGGIVLPADYQIFVCEENYNAAKNLVAEVIEKVQSPSLEIVFQ